MSKTKNIKNTTVSDQNVSVNVVTTYTVDETVKHFTALVDIILATYIRLFLESVHIYFYLSMAVVEIC